MMCHLVLFTLSTALCVPPYFTWFVNIFLSIHNKKENNELRWEKGPQSLNLNSREGVLLITIRCPECEALQML